MSHNPKRVPTIFGMTPAEHVWNLALTYLYAALWKTPTFRRNLGKLKEDFAAEVNDGTLYRTACGTATACLQLGVPLSDGAIDDLYELFQMNPKRPLPEAARARLFSRFRELNVLHFRLQAEEAVIVSDEFPDPFVSGRWAPGRHCPPMHLKDLARKFGMPARGAFARLKALGVDVRRHGRQSYSVPLAALPDAAGG